MRIRPTGVPLGIARLLLYAALTAVLLPAQIVLSARGGRWGLILPPFYHRATCFLLGVRVRVSGAPAAGPALLVANHGSYLDVAVLGSQAPASFVAKAEVRSWPIYGFLARLQRTVFVDRTRRGSVAGGNETAGRLRAGDRIVLFPEGTSSDGLRVLPFKSAYFEAARPGSAEGVSVQPVSIAYTRLNGLPLCRHLRPLVAWYGSMELAPHILNLAGLGRIEVELRFHPVVSAADFPDRKALAAYCQAVVADGVAARLPAPSAVDAEAVEKDAEALALGG